MKELIALPIVFSIVFGLAFELVEIAESSSDKVIRFTESMENALDCAFAGISIEICSPELATINFDEEIARFNETNEKIKNFAEETLAQYTNQADFINSEYLNDSLEHSNNYTNYALEYLNHIEYIEKKISEFNFNLKSDEK